VNDDLRTTFTRAADDAVDGAMPAEQIRRAAAERIRAKRRRRPLFVVGSAVAGLTLVGTGAFAAVQLLGDDSAPLPDVIGSPQLGSAPSETTAPAEPTTGPAEPTAPTEPEPSQPAALPQADPTAVFPACGAVVTPPSGSPDLGFNPSWIEGAAGDTVTARFSNHSGDDLAGIVSAHLTAVAVKDGVVVGWTEQAPPATTKPFDLGDGSEPEVYTTGPLARTLCTDGTTPLPAGRYSIWVSQTATVTERIPYDESFNPGAPITTPEELVVTGDVASLWMDEQGQAVPNPGVAAGWPAQMSQDQAFLGDTRPDETIVWLAGSDREYLMDVDPSLYRPSNQVLDLGYLEPEVPFKCQPEAPEKLGMPRDALSGSGVGVIFAAREDADAFVALWEPLHGPVLGVVTSTVGCHFS
jgi:hypothetical protein